MAINLNPIKMGKKLWDKFGTHAMAVVGFLGLEEAAKEVAGSLKAKVKEEAPRGKLLKAIKKMDETTDGKEALKKLASHLVEAKKNYTENDLVTLLCKMLSDKTEEDVKNLIWLCNLPENGDGFTFTIALDLLNNDKLAQLGQRGLKIIHTDLPKKIANEFDSFSDELNSLCEEIEKKMQ